MHYSISRCDGKKFTDPLDYINFSRGEEIDNLNLQDRARKEGWTNAVEFKFALRGDYIY